MAFKKLVILSIFFVSASKARMKEVEAPSNCPTSYETGNCNYNNLLAHPVDPNKYLQCGSGMEFILSCPDKLVFNSATQVCDYKTSMHEQNDV